MLALERESSGDPDWHRFSTRLNDRRLIVEIAAQYSPAVDEAEQVARDAVVWVAENEWALSRRCADALLEDYNASWIEDESERLTVEEFSSRLHARELTILGDGSARVLFGDGDLFAGHDVIVETGTDREFVDAFLEG